MLIRKINITNFLCYYGAANQFEFVEGLNIVLGANGYGKSKLYDAFQWVFSDGITDNAPRATPGGLKLTNAVKGDLVSEKAKAECDIGDSVETKVVIEVDDQRNGNPRKYQLVRTYRTRRTDEKTWVEPGKSEFQILEYDIVSYKPVAEAKQAEILERLIPVDVRPYVWFQGERGISNLIDTSSNGSLKNVIKRLSDIDRWDTYIEVAERAYKTAQSAFDQVLSKSQKNQVRIGELQTEQRLLETQVRRLEEQITNASQNQQEAQEKIDALSASIEFAQTISKLNQARSQAEAAYTAAVKQSDAFDEGLSRKLFSDNWVLLGTSSLLDKFEDKLTAYDDAIAIRKATANLTKQANEKLQIRLPDNVPEPMYVRQMLDEEHCKVCDRPAPKGSEAYDAIVSLLLSEPEIIQPERPRKNLKSFFRQFYANGLGMKSSIDSINQRVQQSIQEQNAGRERVRSCKEEFEAKARELQQQEQLSGIVNARDIVNSMNGATADIKKFEGDLVGDRNKKKQHEDRLREINSELSKLSEGQVPAHLTQKKTILFDLMELTKRVKKTKYQELVQQLEDTANTHYRNINAPTGAFYGTIRFIETSDGGYRPAILDNDGREVGNLNTSLVSSLKLSIIMAIVSANKTRNYASFYPLISDAPVSDFDVVKAMTFFRETANTFRQSIVIVKELLVEDTTRIGRYKPDLVRLHELRTDLQAADKTLNVYQLDMPDGVSNAFRNELEVTIQKVNC
ncbi:AAA family ATPase [Fibrella aquatilis]|uniref:AAA family ATPase n=1 Tax=Fibrella aquatilis TaxID=2817059 RepID=A0A939JZM1_9BACT|nr:AAA family ATPase [Fibrella aquatilis]MBO0933294.1 AAA family ATPase [Fibrella aquatilis]